MNREILFRGKRVDNKEWIYGLLLTSHSNSFFIECKDGAFYEEVIPETVGQLRYVKGESKYFDGDIYYHAGYGYETVSDLCQLQYSLIIGESEDIGEITGNIHDKE